jgi:hypothetical protein
MKKSCLAVCIEPVAVFFIWMESHFLLDLFSRVSPRALVLKLKSQHSLKVLVHVCFFFAAWFSRSGGMFFPVVQQVANSDFSFLPRLHFLAELTDPVSKVLS